MDEPFEAPSGSESDLAGPSNPSSSSNRPTNLRLLATKNNTVNGGKNKKPSPSPTRRSSQPSLPNSSSSNGYYNNGGASSPDASSSSSSLGGGGGGSGAPRLATAVRKRRTSQSNGNAGRPQSVYDPPQQQPQGSPMSRHQRSTSVQPRSAMDLMENYYWSDAGGGGGPLVYHDTLLPLSDGARLVCGMCDGHLLYFMKHNVTVLTSIHPGIRTEYRPYSTFKYCDEIIS